MEWWRCSASRDGGELGRDALRRRRAEGPVGHVQEADVIQLCIDRLGSYKKPGKVVVRDEPLPKTPGRKDSSGETFGSPTGLDTFAGIAGSLNRGPQTTERIWSIRGQLD